MELEFDTILSHNITLVYESLDLPSVDTAALKRLRGDEHVPTVMDTPDLIVAIYPPEPTVVQLGERRVRLSLQTDSPEPGAVPLWDYAVSCDRMVVPRNSELLAYGFNYDLGYRVTDGDLVAEMLLRFVESPSRIERATGGSLESVIPRYRYRLQGDLHDLILEPLDESRLKVHLNVHRQHEDIELPSAEALRSSFIAECERLKSIVTNLFSEEA